MTERLRSAAAGCSPNAKMDSELFSRQKSMIILVIVVGCFAVLWPKVLYPMLLGSANQHIKPSSIDKTTGCCDVISEIDVNTIKIMSELCGTIIKQQEGGKPPTGKEIVQMCRKEVLETCGIDISAVLQEQVRLGQNVKQILDEIRSLNGSLCLKYNFGVAPWRLGVPHRIIVKTADSSNVKQERPMHLKPEDVHPAFRERGRAIPQSQQQAPSPSRPPPKIIEGRPGPLPGMRPTIGGAGHVVPPPKQGTSSMSIIMPIYTIGIVIFFTYTLMKIIFKKQPDGVGGDLYPSIETDPRFRQEVFEAERIRLAPKLTRENISTKLVVNAMSALLDEVDQEIEARRKSSQTTAQELVNKVSNGDANSHHGSNDHEVQVLTTEITASSESGKKWSQSDFPVVPTPPMPAPEPVLPLKEIYLEGSLPAQSQILVADSATSQSQPQSDEDPSVVLSGTITLSVISLDSENGSDDVDDAEHILEENEAINETLQPEAEVQEEINLMTHATPIEVAVKAENLEETKTVFSSDEVDIENGAENLEETKVQFSSDVDLEHIISETEPKAENGDIKVKFSEDVETESAEIIEPKVQFSSYDADLIIDKTVEDHVPEEFDEHKATFSDDVIEGVEDETEIKESKIQLSKDVETEVEREFKYESPEEDIEEANNGEYSEQVEAVKNKLEVQFSSDAETVIDNTEYNREEVEDNIVTFSGLDSNLLNKEHSSEKNELEESNVKLSGYVDEALEETEKIKESIVTFDDMVEKELEEEENQHAESVENKTVVLEERKEQNATIKDDTEELFIKTDDLFEQFASNQTDDITVADLEKQVESLIQEAFANIKDREPENIETKSVPNITETSDEPLEVAKEEENDETDEELSEEEIEVEEIEYETDEESEGEIINTNAIRINGGIDIQSKNTLSDATAAEIDLSEEEVTDEEIDEEEEIIEIEEDDDEEDDYIVEEPNNINGSGESDTD